MLWAFGKVFSLPLKKVKDMELGNVRKYKYLGVIMNHNDSKIFTCSAICGLLDKDDLRTSHELLNTERIV